MNPCNTPHNSLHCPYNNPEIEEYINISLHLPGISTFIPIDVIVNECITSIAVNQNLYITNESKFNTWLHCNNLMSPIK